MRTFIKILIIITGISFALFAYLIFIWEPNIFLNYSAIRDQETLEEKLHIGMTEQEVSELIGLPDELMVANGLTKWTYYLCFDGYVSLILTFKRPYFFKVFFILIF